MCNYNTGEQKEEDVYVLQCIECNTYQVRIRNAAFIFEPFVYQLFRVVVIEQYQKIMVEKNEDPIIIPTFNGGMDILLNTDELTNLHNLLDDTDTEIRARHLINTFYQ